MIKLGNGRFLTVQLGKSGIWLWLKHNLMKVEEGSRLPWYAQVVHAILYPIVALSYWLPKHGEAYYDFQYDKITLCGVEYSLELFWAWAKHGVPINKPIVVKQRDGRVHPLVLIENYPVPLPSNEELELGEIIWLLHNLRGVPIPPRDFTERQEEIIAGIIKSHSQTDNPQ